LRSAVASAVHASVHTIVSISEGLSCPFTIYDGLRSESVTQNIKFFSGTDASHSFLHLNPEAGGLSHIKAKQKHRRHVIHASAVSLIHEE
jgi:hypothetical protein